ncbi:MAG: hypothetical protein WBD73_06310 [Candidatus Acidiferrales bacterium]
MIPTTTPISNVLPRGIGWSETYVFGLATAEAGGSELCASASGAHAKHEKQISAVAKTA